MNVAILLAAVSFAQGAETTKVPKSEDYPVRKTFSGKPAVPKLVTPGQRQFRTMIREAAKGGPNFAGHYAIAEWGCGTACEQIAVIDVESGDVFEGPFGILPRGFLNLGANVEDDKTGMFYRRDSSLFIVRGCPNDTEWGNYYYVWAGTRFKLLRKVAIKKPFGCGEH